MSASRPSGPWVAKLVAHYKRSAAIHLGLAVGLEALQRPNVIIEETAAFAAIDRFKAATGVEDDEEAARRILAESD